MEWSEVEMWQKWLVAGWNTVGWVFPACPGGGRPSLVRFDSPLCCSATQTLVEELVEGRDWSASTLWADGKRQYTEYQKDNVKEMCF